MYSVMSRPFITQDLRSLSFVAFLCASTMLGAAQRTDPFASVLPAYLQGTRSNPLTSDEVFDIFHSKETVAKSTTKVGMLFPASPPAIYPNEFRTIDGSRNAPSDLGSAGSVDLRNTTIGYADGLGTPGGATRKGAREISNLVNFQTAPIPNSVNVSGFVWNWGNVEKTGAKFEDFTVNGGEGGFNCELKGKLWGVSRMTTTDLHTLEDQLRSRIDFIYASSNTMNELDRNGDLEWGRLACSKMQPKQLTDQEKADREAKAREKMQREVDRRRAHQQPTE
jgi:hypothetical protein